MTSASPTTYARISPIRDIIHNYLNFSLFERDIIDSVYFQRLHFVLQNSAAYSAYPCNKNSRFVHSLGVSHVCGRLFIHGLKNAHPTVLASFLTSADQFIGSMLEAVSDRSTTYGDATESWKRTVGSSARFLHNPPGGIPLDIVGLGLRFECDFVVNTLWVALKICGLAHDVGHLPMSHSFEDAIKDINNICYLLGIEQTLEDTINNHKKPQASDAFAGDRPDLPTTLKRFSAIMGASVEDINTGLLSLTLHERRGLRILDEIKRNPVNKYNSIDNIYRDLVFNIAEVILLSSKKSFGIGHSALLAAMRDIVAGGLDADRLDYTMRDPKASGLELGVFDLDRIITNCTLCRVDGRLQFSFADNCISAIESFFHQRYLIYSTLVYHRTAVRTKAILRELIARLIAFAYRRPDDVIAELLERAGVLDRTRIRSGNHQITALLPGSRKSLSGFDDARLRTMLFDIVSELGQRSGEERGEGHNEIEMLSILAETFLFRKRENWRSFGKTTVSAKKYLEELSISDVNPFILGESVVKNGFRDFITKKRKEICEKYDGKLCLLISEIPPKIYNRKDSLDSKVYITARGKEDAALAEELSSFLSSQYEIVGRDMDWAASFVAKDIRNSTLESDAESIFKEILIFTANLKRATLNSEAHELEGEG